MIPDQILKMLGIDLSAVIPAAVELARWAETYHRRAAFSSQEDTSEIIAKHDWTRAELEAWLEDMDALSNRLWNVLGALATMPHIGEHVGVIRETVDAILIDASTIAELASAMLTGADS